MGRYIIRRVLQAIPLLFMVSIVVFGLIHLIPGGADAVFLNPKLSGAARAAIRHNLGLDQPIVMAYFSENPPPERSLLRDLLGRKRDGVAELL